MSINYGWEKLHLAVHSLCGQGPQSQRLVNAVIYNLIHVNPENNLPEEILDEFQSFMDEINSVKAQDDEGTVRATVNTLDEIGVDDAVKKIISFYDTVCRHMKPF